MWCWRSPQGTIKQKKYFAKLKTSRNFFSLFVRGQERMFLAKNMGRKFSCHCPFNAYKIHVYDVKLAPFIVCLDDVVLWYGINFLISPPPRPFHSSGIPRIPPESMFSVLSNRDVLETCRFGFEKKQRSFVNQK